MASVAFKLTTSAKLNSIAITDGQLVFVQPDQGQTVGKLYLDFHGTRTQYGSIGETPAPDQYATHYLGVSTTPPSSGTVTVDGDVLTPAWGDIVAYDGGMYLYNGTTWVEIGSSSGATDQYVTHYRGIMDAIMRHKDNVSAVVVWGVTDELSIFLQRFKLFRKL